MASTKVNVVITVDSDALAKTQRTYLEVALAAAIEPAVKRELRKELAKLHDGSSQPGSE